MTRALQRPVFQAESFQIELQKLQKSQAVSQINKNIFFVGKKSLLFEFLVCSLQTGYLKTALGCDAGSFSQ
jgi:hypothetical protein